MLLENKQSDTFCNKENVNCSNYYMYYFQCSFANYSTCIYHKLLNFCRHNILFSCLRKSTKINLTKQSRHAEINGISYVVVGVSILQKLFNVNLTKINNKNNLPIAWYAEVADLNVRLSQCDHLRKKILDIKVLQFKPLVRCLHGWDTI